MAAPAIAAAITPASASDAIPSSDETLSSARCTSLVISASSPRDDFSELTVADTLSLLSTVATTVLTTSA